MNKSYLFRKASVIHAIKCNTENMTQSYQSLDRLSEFLQRLREETDLAQFNRDLDTWAAEEPIASPGEINNMMVKK
jgi:hypothetical protein